MSPPSTQDVVCLLISDCQFSHTAPSARAEKGDEWYNVQSRYLGQLRHIQRQCGAPPIFCAGDVLDRWDSPPELINFLCECLPTPFYAVPGNHDLPNGSLEQMKRSAYWTLVEAGKICHLEAGVEKRINPKLYVVGLPWSYHGPIQLCKESREGVRLIVQHRYAWKRGCDPVGKGFMDDYLPNTRVPIDNDHIHHLGDNHCNFMERFGGRVVVNSGTFMRRHKNEIPYRPTVTLVYESGAVLPWYLDTSKDRFVNDEVERPVESVGLDTEKLKQSLLSLASSTENFVEAVTMACKNHSTAVQEVVKDCVEKAKAEALKEDRR